MQLQLNLGPGTVFFTTARQVGLSDKGAEEMLTRANDHPANQIIWRECLMQSDKLRNLVPRGSA